MLFILMVPLYFLFLVTVSVPMSKYFGALLENRKTGTYDWEI